MLEAGQVIDGKYRIVRLIGEGGMGAVFEGENTLIHRRVAIKVLNAALAKNAEIVGRFEREAQAAGRIGNDHILEVLDLGSLPDGDRYLVLEYLEGETLLDRIRHYGRLEPERVAPIARQFLSALSAAHKAGVIHRDLKPENIFIIREKAGRLDFVKLIDFGVSKFQNLGGDSARFTRAGALIGTPCYLSPEQARGAGEADVRSDIYSSGVILYEAITGRVPFESDNFNDLMFKIALSDVPPPRTFQSGIDADFERIVLRAMAREPAARYQSVEELSAAIEDWAESRGVSLSLVPSRGQRVSSPEFPRQSQPKLVLASETVLAVTQQADSSPIPAKGSGPAGDDGAVPDFAPARRSRIAIAAGAASVIVVASLAVFLSSSSPPPPTPVGIKPAEPSSAAAKEARDEPPPPPLPTPPTPATSATNDAPKPSASVAVRPLPSATAKAGVAATAVAAPKPPPSSRPKGPKAPDFGY